ncbi:MAG: ribbon-helix-helix domain-containing protein [Propionibacteriaceae bacterium]|jgi:metal-responsive CopG/Arc/MetJ family transcriptional regulator|nr:ribbon-helix-helix domain-containing protein [Propionibacteriaceae bacterium]
MKTAISIPDDVFKQLEAAAHDAGLSRSEFYRNAGLSYAAELKAANVTAAIDAYVAANGELTTEWTALSAKRLEEATVGDEW